MTEVILHVYDVTNSGSEKTNSTIMQINKIFKDGIGLGGIFHSAVQVNQVLRELSREWHGSSYDLLSKNCNHFCDELCDRLGVQKLPGWVNRFANAGDAALEVAGNTALRFRQAKTEIVSASKVAYRFLAGVASNNGAASETPGSSSRGTPMFQAAWFKNLITTGAKPSSSTEIDNQDEDVLLRQQQEARPDVPQQRNL